MEEFVGRGDRRLCEVIRRAHKLGAGMDAWWNSTETAYSAWTQAIEESGLGWNYRKAEAGEWNLVETAAETIRGPRGWFDEARARALDRNTLLPRGGATQTLQESPLDRPLPWDHIDTGINKGWLRDELMRALTETLTPDCAFSECSSCGVCGEAMGNNVTIPPPPVPQYTGEARPNSNRIQRIRMAMEKTGAMALASHLDMFRLLDRLLRRSSLPISFTEGFHPRPRVSTAAALPFGATASEEPYDFVLHKRMSVGEFRRRVTTELPAGLNIGEAVEVSMSDPSLSKAMTSGEYVLAVTSADSTRIYWDNVLREALASGPVEVEKISKNGLSTTRDLRAMLHDVALASPREAAPVLEHVGLANWPDNGVVLRCRLMLNNEGAMSPDDFMRLLNSVPASRGAIELLHVHRMWINDHTGTSVMTDAVRKSSVLCGPSG